MRSNCRSEKGFALIETIIAAALLGITALAVLSFTTRSLKSLHTIAPLMRPPCQRPSCSLGVTSSSCGCGERPPTVVIE